jgi:hypothetical protein
MRTGHEMMTEMRAWWREMKADRVATEAYKEKMEANPNEMQSLAECQEVAKEEAAVKVIGALKDRYRGRHVAVGSRRWMKKWTQGAGSSRKRLAAMTLPAIPASRKGRGRQGPGKNNVVGRNRKAWME